MIPAARLLALTAFAAAALACTTPTGIRPSRLVLRYDAGDDSMNGRAMSNGAGVELEFEFTYPEPLEDPGPEDREGER